MAIHFDGWLRKNYGAHYDVLQVGWLTVYRAAKDEIDLYSLSLFALQISESTKTNLRKIHSVRLNSPSSHTSAL
jgi:hypothetical protein